MKTYDARWLGTEAVKAAWLLTLYHEADIEDIEGAIAAGDLTTAFEAVVLAKLRLGEIRHILQKVPSANNLEGQLVVLAAESDGALGEYVDMGSALDCTKADLERLLDEIIASGRAIAAELPFSIPKVRTPEGFFPTVRALREIDELRNQAGLTAVHLSELVI